MLEVAFWGLYFLMFVTGAVNFHVGGQSIFVNNVILALFAPLALLKCLYNRRIAYPTWLWLVLLLFLASLAAGIAINIGLAAAVQCAQIVIFVVSILATRLVVHRRVDIQRWFVMTSVGCAANAVVGLFQSLLWIKQHGLVLFSGGLWFRVQGLFVSPIDYITALMIGLALSNAIHRRWLRWTANAVYCLLLLLSMSRSGIIVVAVAGAIWTVRLFRSRASFVKKLLAVVAGLFAVAGIFSVRLISERVADIGSGGFNAARLLTFQDAMRQSTSDPLRFLFGHGLGSYVFYNPSAQEIFTNTHNVYLLFLYTTGVVGLAIFIALVLGLVGQCFRLLRAHLGTPLEQRLPQAVLLAHVFVWLVALVESNILGVGSGWLIGSVLGLPLAIVSLVRAE